MGRFIAEGYVYYIGSNPVQVPMVDSYMAKIAVDTAKQTHVQHHTDQIRALVASGDFDYRSNPKSLIGFGSPGSHYKLLNSATRYSNHISFASSIHISSRGSNLPTFHPFWSSSEPQKTPMLQNCYHWHQSCPVILKKLSLI